jgi:hypothetical protein
MFLLAKVATNKTILTIAGIAALGIGGAAIAYVKIPKFREWVQGGWGKLRDKITQNLLSKLPGLDLLNNLPKLELPKLF